MYDSLETQKSKELLIELTRECNKRKIPIALIGGWGAFFHVNSRYREAFGKDYTESRDIDIFFDPNKEKEFHDLIKLKGFQESGYYFRWEKIYSRTTKTFITQEEARKEEIFNLIYIFLDLFSNKETKVLKSWWNIGILKNISYIQIDEFSVADINTLIGLKCTALFERDKADKETKDACDIYALLQYSGKEIVPTPLIVEAIKKILNRFDLLYYIATHVILNSGNQDIVEITLRDILKQFTEK